MSFDGKRKERAKKRGKGTMRQRKVRLKRRGSQFDLQPGQPSQSSKLNDAIEERICGIIASGMSFDDACHLCGITRATLYNWRSIGTAEPESRYGEFLGKVELAITASRSKMVKKLLDDPDWKATWKIMINRWPTEFKEAYMLRQELSGPDGGPVPMSVQSFNVILELHHEQSTNEPQREFRIEGQGNGAVHAAPSPRSDSNGSS